MWWVFLEQLLFLFLFYCIGSNILLARMATRKAKPDGQYHLKPEEVDDFIRSQLVTSLPGKHKSFLCNIYYKHLLVLEVYVISVSKTWIKYFVYFWVPWETKFGISKWVSQLIYQDLNVTFTFASDVFYF